VTTTARNRHAAPAVPASSDGTRQRILETATALFLERGYKGTSTKAIAKRVGISAPALYWHFESKEAILFAFIESALDEFIAEMQAAASAESDPAAQLAAVVRAYVGRQLRRAELAGKYDTLYGHGQLAGALPERQQRALRARQDGFVDLLRGILRHGQRARQFEFEDATVTAFAVITICEYVFTWAKPEGRLAPEAIADRYARLVLGMVHPEQARTRARAGPGKRPPRRKSGS
jgi:AcrR family transcriptional regulator